MEDLDEACRKELERELREAMVEARRQKLVCFQKMRNRVIKKADTVAASGTKVDASPSPEDLVQLVYVSITSKYRADLTQFT
jgi:ADP-ribose pyrophosphatase YjhB (NUDIX family)